MRYEFTSDIRYGREEKENHRIELDLDLALDDFIQSRNVAVELTVREEEIRREIFLVVLNQILKKIVEDTGIPWDFDGKVGTTHSIDIHGSASITHSKVSGESLTMRDKLKMVMDIQADRPVNAMQAIRASNHAIAMSVANDIIHHLKIRYLGITKSSTSSATDMKDGKLNKFDVRDRTNFIGN